MKTKILLSVFLFCSVLISSGQRNSSTSSEIQNSRNIPDHIRERKAFKRAEWFNNQRAFPNDVIPVAKYAKEVDREIQKTRTMRLKSSAPLTWTSVGPSGVKADVTHWGTISGRVRTVAVHPTDPLTVYIGAASGGIWKTTDGGATWQDIGRGLESLTFGAIAIDPKNPETIYAGSGESNLLESFFCSAGSGLYKSLDGGQNWNLITSGFGTMTFFSDMVVSPYNSNIVIASLGGGNVFTGVDLSNEGVWKSTDGGLTWNRMLNVKDAFDIAFHPTDSNKVFAAAGGYISKLKGFYFSTDQGTTWTTSNTGLLLPTNGGRIQFDISKSDPDIIYAVIYTFTNDDPNKGITRAFKSVNGGSNWSQISTGTNLGGLYPSGLLYDQGWYDLCIAIDPVDPNHVLIGNIELHRTTNGSKFTPVRPFGNNAYGSLVHMDYHKLVFAPSNPKILYIGCDGGLYKSMDKGYTATSQNLGLSTLQFYRIASHPLNPQVLIGGMQDNGSAMTTDGGSTWNEISSMDGTECFFSHNPDTVYTSAQYGFLFRSINGGTSFSELNSNINGAFITPFLLHPTNNKILYVANKKILKSTNAGSSFKVISGASDVAPSFISTMAQSQINPNFMIFGSGTDHPHFDTVFIVKISTNEGATWTDVTTNIPGEVRWISRVATDPVDDSTMYVLRTGFSPGNKIYKTSNLGQTWTNISDDLPDLPCNDLFIDPENTNHIYVANDIGVYRSTDGGTGWTNVSDGIPVVPAIDFDYIKIGTVRYLRVGTFGRSIYETKLEPVTGLQNHFAMSASSPFGQVYNYPNPFSSLTTISWQLAQSSKVTLKVLDIVGRTVATLVDEQRPQGKYETQFNAAILPKGIYFYQLKAGEFSQTRKMILLD
jgi:photosystem II stability/assembly factor-like uncharacterized protein